MPAGNTVDWQARDSEQQWELSIGPAGPYVAIGSDVKLDSGKKIKYLIDQQEFLTAK